MRRWGIIVTVFYAVIVFALLLPGAVILAVESKQDVLSVWLESYGIFYSENDFSMALFQIWPFLLVAGQILLLFLSVDTSVRQFKPRRHIMYSAVWTALATMLLVYFAAASLIVAFFGEGSSWDWVVNPWILVWWLGLWAFWGVVFYLYYRRGSLTLERAVSWLLKGSVLELLIAVPAHALVRYREDCSAPIVTGFGIVTGIAIMLMCFGPSILSLYKKRIEEIESRRRARQRINN